MACVQYKHMKFMSRLAMSSSVFIFITLSSIVVLPNCYSGSQLQGSDDGIEVSLGDRVIPNHGMVATQDIGVDSTGMNLEIGLKCSTTYTQGCCRDFQYNVERRDGEIPSGTGSWLQARSGAAFPYISRQVDGPTHTFGIRRNGSAVYVFRNKNSAPYITDGIWRCVIPDSNGSNQTKYIGVYANSNNGIVHPALTTLEYTLLNTNPVMFNLTFRTTGGPASQVTWSRDGSGVNISEDNRYTPSQNVIPNGNGIFTAGDYDNILTVNGRLSGVYGVSVTNDRTTTPVTPTTDIIIIDYPQAVITNGSAMQSADVRNVILIWTVSNSSLVTRYFDGYEIQTRRCPLGQQTTGCDDLQTVQTTSTQYTLTDVTLWVTYEFNIALVNISNHFFLPGVSGLYLGGIQISTIGILRPEITSESANDRFKLANITSVQVTWNQPVGGLTVDEYVMSYQRLNGRDGQCSSFQDEGSAIVSAMGEGVNHTVILHLQAYSVYSCTVTARNLRAGLYNETTINISTSETVPSGAPQNLTIINSTSTSVTIFWDSVECIHRNGMIIHYIISYGPTDDCSQVVIETVNNNGPDGGGRFTGIGIMSNKIYTFKVAAINNAGVGLFATMSQSKGTQTTGCASCSATIAGMASVIVILVLVIAVLSGVIIACWVSKTRIRSLPQAKDKHQGEGSETQSKPNEAFYEEINIPSKAPKTSIEMETCPAYEVTMQAR